MSTVSASRVVRGWVARMSRLATADAVYDADRVELLTALEELKSAAAAAQAVVTVDFDASQREEQERQGVPRARLGRGVAEQVALARRESPHRGGRFLGMARALTAEMPCTMAALQSGRISEWRAGLLVRETACLSREDRARVDEELAGVRLAELAAMGDRAVVAEARRLAYHLDPAAVTERARRAPSQRRVTLRPAPDTMTYLTALLPVEEGVACWAVLSRLADSARAVGDPRTRGQVMADSLVSAVAAAAGVASERGSTGQSPAGRPDDAPAESCDDPAEQHAGDPTAFVRRATRRSAVAGISLQVVMTDRALFDGDDEPAHLVGHGTVPAGWARDLLRRTEADVWLRRLHADPSTGRILGGDRRARLFRGALREVLVARDQRCRTPWCDAPIRHVDHVRRHAEGGETTFEGGQGLCERCNLAKEAPGWRARAASPPAARHLVTTTTPTGHVYHSRAPTAPGATPVRASRLEVAFGDLLRAG